MPRFFEVFEGIIKSNCFYFFFLCINRIRKPKGEVQVMPNSMKALVMCALLAGMIQPLWSEALDKSQIDSAVNASLDALKVGSISFECTQTRPADNVTALGAAELENSQKMGFGGKITASHDVLLPGEGTCKWNQDKFITSFTETHIEQANRQTLVLNHQFAWDGVRLTSLVSEAASIHNALEETVSDWQTVEGSEKIQGEILGEKDGAMIMFDPIVWVLERSHVAGPDGMILNAESVESQPDGTILVKKGITRMTLDPGKGSLPVRISHTPGQSGRGSETVITYKELPGQVWFPVGLVKTQTENGKPLVRIEYKVTSWSLEPPETSFSIDFPAGVPVDNRLSSK